MGAVSPLGLDESTLWGNMVSGKTGIGRVRAVDTKDLKTTVGAEVNDELLLAAMQARGLLKSDRAVDMALVAAGLALEQAGILNGAGPYAPTEMPTIFGTAIGATQSSFGGCASFAQKGVRGVRPTTVPRGMANAISAQISMKYRLTGANYVVVSACSSSTNAIGIAFRMIRDGYADMALCGGAEAPFEPFVFAAWNNLGVMSKNQDPAKACRPFDAARDGCVLGEGAGALVLETLESAQARKANIRAEICGYGESSDAGHITTPSAEGQVRCMRAALECAGMNPADIGYINAHGTATKANDECEAESIRLALGDAASAIPVGSNKSFFGHMLGGAGVMEVIVTVLGLEHRKVPPNLNLDNPDPACNLFFVGGTEMEVSSPVVMKNGFGFGGGNAVLIIKRSES
jgi:3-oxoacyl-[acyl-carrier-protein] synthase II